MGAERRGRWGGWGETGGMGKEREYKEGEMRLR